MRDHFDQIAHQYDDYKSKASYYHSYLKRLIKELIGDTSSKSILEIGCGTGALLAYLAPCKGKGVDISKKMVQCARSIWKSRTELEFETGEAETYLIKDFWDVVILADVIEHLFDSERTIKNLSAMLTPETTLLITWANSSWTWILHLLETLRLKMPEGDHRWETRDEILYKLESNGFSIIREGTRCFIPAALPLADQINQTLSRMPFFNKMGLIRFILARKSA